MFTEERTVREATAHALERMAEPARIESVDDEEEEMNLMETGDDGVFNCSMKL